MLIADEVHELGSTENSKAMTIESGARLGLGATPQRYGDTAGTLKIFDYFGPVVPPPFTLVDAIRQGRLVPYEYHPGPIRLTADESESWEVATREISREYARSKRDDNGNAVISPRLQNMLITRSRIAKKAATKVPYAVKTVVENYIKGQSWLIYCEDQHQLGEVVDALRSRGYEPVEYHTNMKGDADASLDWFKRFGGIMVSIRCLDQGVDIPKISHAIILASSQTHGSSYNAAVVACCVCVRESTTPQFTMLWWCQSPGARAWSTFTAQERTTAKHSILRHGDEPIGSINLPVLLSSWVSTLKRSVLLIPMALKKAETMTIKSDPFDVLLAVKSGMETDISDDLLQARQLLSSHQYDKDPDTTRQLQTLVEQVVRNRRTMRCDEIERTYHHQLHALQRRAHN